MGQNHHHLQDAWLHCVRKTTNSFSKKDPASEHFSIKGSAGLSHSEFKVNRTTYVHTRILVQSLSNPAQMAMGSGPAVPYA